uniref:HD domain-containing protein n=2 Tax=Pseudomonadota TaxID=1224 RepID=UPI000E202AAF
LLVHDIVEIDAGDTFAYDHVARTTQAERELKAAERIFAILPADQAVEFRALWDEFELKATAEARFANAMDRLQPTLHN